MEGILIWWQNIGKNSVFMMKVANLIETMIKFARQSALKTQKSIEYLIMDMSVKVITEAPMKKL